MSDDKRISIPASAWGDPGLTAVAFAAGAQFDNVGFLRGDQEILSAINFELRPREIICLVGPSGCGKTTVLRLLGGAERVSSGRITIDRKIVSDKNHFIAPERRHVGMVFQDYALFPHLSVMDNVLFGLNKIEKSAAHAQAVNALQRVGLIEKAKAFPNTLSGGEQQRVALARAIAPRPSILLLDEPFSSLDQRLRDEVRTQTLAVLRETRASCVIVTHDPEEALALADRVIVMRSGRIIQIGTPEDIYKNPIDSETAEFFSLCNIVDAEQSQEGLLTPFGIIPQPQQADRNLKNYRVILRLHALEPCAPSEGRACLVKEKIYEGEFTRLSLLPEGMEKLFWARVPSHMAVKLGDQKRFKINPEHSIVFPLAHGEDRP